MPRRPKIVPVSAPGESQDGQWKVELSAKVSETGRRRRQYFPTKGAAEEFCKEARDRLADVTDAGRYPMTLEQRQEATICQRVAREHGFTLTTATEAMRVLVEQARRSIPVSKLVEEFLAYKRSRNHSPDYLRDMTFVLRRFGGAHKEVLASELTAEGVGTWIDTLKLGSPVSWNNNRRLISVLLNFAWRHKPPYVAANVLTGLEQRQEKDAEVEVYTNEEARALLDAAKAGFPLFVPALAIGFFAGVRPDETRRLDWSEVHWPEGDQPGHVEVKASKSKTARRRLIEMQPVLVKWLEPYHERTGKVWPQGRHGYYDTLAAVRKAGGEVRTVDDGFRHSFASNHLAFFNDIGRLTNELGHQTSAMLFEHYRRVVRRADAETFFNLFPHP